MNRNASRAELESPAVRIENPVLRGFNPDPCMIRVKETYYIAVSSFEWLPGIRIYESRDLTEWSHRTDVLAGQAELAGNPRDCSIWAPQLSFADDLFYLIYTDVKSTRRPFKDVRNYLITAPSIDGPWSEPIYLNGVGFDPSLFHDEDGRKWLLNVLWDHRIPEGNKSAGIAIQQYDPERRRLTGRPVKIFGGTELRKTEAPHLYRHNGLYYLVTAEGGTGAGHAVTVARSRNLLGPYEVDPRNPMLTSSDRPDWPLQCAGHASLVQTPGGDWVIAHLCTRPVEGKYAILGRETALQRVEWDEEGWLRLAAGGHTPQPAFEVPAEYANRPEGFRQPAAAAGRFEDDFAGSDLGRGWNSPRILPGGGWCSLTARPGYLRITSGESPQSLFRHHLLAVRQTDFAFRAETSVEYRPDSFMQMAGLMLYLSESKYLYACVTADEEAGRVLSVMRGDGEAFEFLPQPVSVDGAGEIGLAVEVDGAEARFCYRGAADKDWRELGASYRIGFLSGGFTGCFVGICVHDLERLHGSFADFGFFRYLGRS
ncbi:glycoside hydrolase family 43 protein [Saccharibacillus alkalitolerans]|uniref:Glycoside hydrolase family 43 protein n=1 Tax=Saccharibacillus alkalitolerans TaxID=2705290 RepID=A0ABX0EZY9_9BACL|nr:glycoside hydrolase family 43 protein [Saccharibacillus alkalitolerans]NGZ74316.1 glycoside hydrolase family 43 protein [Saccharibacillus alkalitolerans]